MLNRLSVRLEAHSNELDRHRIYIVEIGQDLFGAHTVDVGFGRLGSWQKTQRFAFETPQDAARLAMSRLRRRATARKRIGCPYQLIDGQSKDHIDKNYSIDISMFRAASG